MKSSFVVSRWLGAALLAVCLSLSLVGGVGAEEKEFKGPHPLRVLKARYQSDKMRGTASSSAKGNLTLWVQNITSVVVDGIDVDVELYNDHKRKVETLERTIGELGPGEKKVLTFRWDVVAEDDLFPRFFLEYNARGNQKERFEGDTPSFQ